MKTLSDFIKETLTYSIDTDKTIEKLSKLEYVIKCKKEISKKYSVITVTIDDNIFDSDDFASKLNSLNYFLSTIYDKSNKIYDIVIIPRLTECISDFIYNDNKGIIYHLTTEDAWNSIKRDKGIVPKKKNKKKLNNLEIRIVLNNLSFLFQ